jgi:hypothetical protein
MLKAGVVMEQKIYSKNGRDKAIKKIEREF